MLFIASFHWLEFYNVMAWLVLLFHVVIFLAENSDHHKQSMKGARMGVFLFGNRPVYYCEK